MITEDYNGVCPECGYERCLVRYGSIGYFQFFACPSCRFAFGDNSEKIYTQDEVWESILRHESNNLKKGGHNVSIDGIKGWLESMEKPKDRFVIKKVGEHWDYMIQEV